MQANLEVKQHLTTQELIILESEMKWRTKSAALAFILWWFISLFFTQRTIRRQAYKMESKLIPSIIQLRQSAQSTLEKTVLDSASAENSAETVAEVASTQD